jgi:hypothetical protein
MQEELGCVVDAAGAALGAQEAEALVIGAHAESLLRVARRHSLCAKVVLPTAPGAFGP